jgi:hypothetical protein
MKRRFVTTVALGALLAIALIPVLADDPPARLVRISGWIVDEESGEAHANAESKDAILAKQEEGAVLVFFTTKGDIYGLTDQETAWAHVGQKWDALGKLDADGNLTVGKFMRPRVKKPQAASEGEDEAEAPAED